MRAKPYFQKIIWLFRRLIKSTLSFVLLFSLFYILKCCSSMLIFLERIASSHFKIVGPLRLFAFFKVLIFGEKEIGVDFDFVVEMEFIFLFDILCECLFVGEKMIVEKILFTKGLSFDFLFVFEDLIDGGGFGVWSFIKFVHKNIVIF